MKFSINSGTTGSLLSSGVRKLKRDQSGFVFTKLQLLNIKNDFEKIYTFNFIPLSPFQFEAGQCCHLMLHNAEIGPETVRHMSIASSPDDPTVDFSMEMSSSYYKRSIASLETGDFMEIFKIKGDFTIDTSLNRPVVFLAGGIGITPVRSLIRHLKSSYDWTLMHVSRSDHLYRNEFKKHGQKQYRWNRAQFINVLPDLIKRYKNHWFYICGSESFIKGSMDMLLKAGIPESSIKVEDFH